MTAGLSTTAPLENKDRKMQSVSATLVALEITEGVDMGMNRGDNDRDRCRGSVCLGRRASLTNREDFDFGRSTMTSDETEYCITR